MKTSSKFKASATPHTPAFESFQSLSRKIKLWETFTEARLPLITPFVFKVMLFSVMTTILGAMLSFFWLGLLVGACAGAIYYKDLREDSWQMYVAQAFYRYRPVDKEAYARVDTTCLDSFKEWLIIELSARHSSKN